jgi:hypothetical protein
MFFQKVINKREKRKTFPYTLSGFEKSLWPIIDQRRNPRIVNVRIFKNIERGGGDELI